MGSILEILKFYYNTRSQIKRQSKFYQIWLSCFSKRCTILEMFCSGKIILRKCKNWDYLSQSRLKLLILKLIKMVRIMPVSFS